MRPQGKRLSATLMACLLACGCEGPTQPSSPGPPLVDTFSPTRSLSQLAGSYSMTLNISDQCIGIPAAVRQRTYQAILEPTPSGYLGVRVVGVGYSQPVGIGHLHAGPESQVLLSWNDFDLGACYDVYSEPLEANARLTVCGSGFATLDGSTIAGTLNADAWIDDAGVRESICRGAHEFRFTRTDAMSTRR